MIKFYFPVNEKSQEYCEWIAEEMQNIFKISKEEAVGRINAFWSRNVLTDDDDIVYHETAEFWAYQIYSKDRFWWNMNKEDITPRDYKKK
ncbi:hypothetical protein QWJ34_19210 [Saccharibacillus sp. CPCC 101409]|uniref:hypothetical protein n=1 Tax=Saccharibacillus sp. CPCC 101409 TaxID=3058041 RepID=UPI002673C79B|nr:hypothetical protein [Saccharibacillus sp. CPCC 101409]MDO3411900.1 hypothetical protein [Saccharibacillus sp. CPCC 101409]